MNPAIGSLISDKQCIWVNSFFVLFHKISSTFINYSIKKACCIGDELHNKNSCILVHGWDGSDNTLVVTSLVQILLNPECRTLEGFQNLIEREWLLAGHPFSKRCFKTAYGTSQSKQEGPVFLLFLDCVRQVSIYFCKAYFQSLNANEFYKKYKILKLLEQFPISFEFNEELLIILYDNSVAPQYGTFLANCQRERENLCLANRTRSLW